MKRKRWICAWVFALSILPINSAVSASVYQQIAVTTPNGKIIITMKSADGLQCKKNSEDLYSCEIKFDSLYSISGRKELVIKDLASFGLRLSKFEINGNISIESSSVANPFASLNSPADKVVLKTQIPNMDYLKIELLADRNDLIVDAELSSLPLLDPAESVRLNSHETSSMLEWKTYYPESNKWMYASNRQSSGQCKFGYQNSLDDRCDLLKWTDIDKTDNFDREFSLEMPSQNVVSGTVGASYFQILCKNRKLSAGFSVYLPASTGGWQGEGQYIFDKTKPVKFKYAIDRNLKKIWIDSPKIFLSKFFLSKENVAFKIPRESEILIFPKSDLNNWKSRLKKSGCI